MISLRPSTYGYGATPSGWLAAAAFVAPELLLAGLLLGVSGDAGLGRVFGFLAASALLVAGVMRISRTGASGAGPGARQKLVR